AKTQRTKTHRHRRRERHESHLLHRCFLRALAPSGKRWGAKGGGQFFVRNAHLPRECPMNGPISFGSALLCETDHQER
ncbi:MAG: hypothetical protein WBV18_04575, partial [Methyloceanibacter sp.]|uniref:hypothetical protein n=1 Tax=Methyloceanibacter sp. TaxID=1965321 RepID=UPI003C578F83